MAQMIGNLVIVNPMECVTLKVQFPRLIGARIKAAILLIRAAAAIVGCGIQIDVVGESDKLRVKGS